MILNDKLLHKIFILFYFIFASKLCADIVDTNITNIITIQSVTQNPTQEKLQALSGLNTKSVSGIKVNIVDLNLGKNSALKIDYSPKLNHEGIINIDNHKETTVKFQYKF